MKNNMFKKTISVVLVAALTSSFAMTAFATETALNDFRVTDQYTSLTYGSVNNAVLQYTGSDTGVVMTEDGASINTTETFTLLTREDILDSVARYENIEFAMTANVTSCDNLVISAVNGENASELYNATPVSGENEFSVTYADGTATLLLNGATVQSATVAEVPQITITGSNAVMEISGVRYGEAVMPETDAQAQIRASINAATDSATMETALLSYLADEGKDGVYSSLPDCDKTEIKDRMLTNVPFESRAALVNGYQKALEYTTQADLAEYNKVLTEDFSNLDSGWTKTNVIDAAIGSGKANGTARPSLAITDEANSFMFFGGALNPKAANYIERTVANSKSVATMYIKVANNNALSFSALFDGTQGIQLKNTGVRLNTNTGGDTKVDISTDKWNKIVFDGTETGTVKCYVNGTLAATFSGSITKLSVGTIFNFASWSVIAVDNITIAEKRTVEEHLAEFNESAVTEEKLTYMLDKAKVSTDVFGVLPQCDKSEIVSRMETARPFADLNTFKTAYQKAVEYTTQADLDDYKKVFTEDFSNLDSGWTKTNIVDGAIGSGTKHGTARQALAITDELNSFMFFGAALAPNNANYIERTVENPKSVITMYIKVANNNALSFSAWFDGTQGIQLKNTGVRLNTNTGGDTKVDISTDKWNKIVFDGTETGTVKCYVNGALAATFNGSITKLTVGTTFNFSSYSVIAVDNITIAEPQYLEKFNKSEVTKESLVDMLAKAEVSAELLGVLPECDVTEIVSRMEAARPFADVNTFKTTYQKALEYTTQADLDKYSKVWTEDFSQGLGENWTIQGTLRNNSVGTNQMIDSTLPRKYLNISGTDTASAGFVGASFNNNQKNYIEREVGAENAVVTLYFYDTMYNDKGYFYAGVNGECVIGLSASATYYTKRSGSGWQLTNIERSEGWHKIVFDGATMPGVVTAYMDGIEVFQTETQMSNVTVGNVWAEPSYYCAWVDNITVSKSIAVEAVKVLNKGIEITDNELPATETVTVKIENPSFTADYIVATYEGNRLLYVYLFTKEEQRNGNIEEDITISDATEMKIFEWEDIATLKPVGDVICLTK